MILIKRQLKINPLLLGFEKFDNSQVLVMVYNNGAVELVSNDENATMINSFIFNTTKEIFSTFNYDSFKIEKNIMAIVISLVNKNKIIEIGE